ncbi:hypothetical protein JW935_23715, partial [candidate division KSB1 bacterium]|nr:hypothetical protein [candidate division KSB1 bacterium]
CQNFKITYIWQKEVRRTGSIPPETEVLQFRCTPATALATPNGTAAFKVGNYVRDARSRHAKKNHNYNSSHAPTPGFPLAVDALLLMHHYRGAFPFFTHGTFLIRTPTKVVY